MRGSRWRLLCLALVTLGLGWVVWLNRDVEEVPNLVRGQDGAQAVEFVSDRGEESEPRSLLEREVVGVAGGSGENPTPREEGIVRIRGAVVDEGGSGMEDASVYVEFVYRPLGESGMSVDMAKTNRVGEYELKISSAELKRIVRIVATLDESQIAAIRPETRVDIADDQASIVKIPELVCRRLLSMLTGRVMSRSGTPVGGASVVWLRGSVREATTNSEGRYEVWFDDSVDSRDFMVAAEGMAAWCADSPPILSAEGTSWQAKDIYLVPGITLRGIVRDAKGRAVSGVGIGSVNHPAWLGRTDSRGTFVAPGVEEGSRISLSFWHESFAPVEWTGRPGVDVAMLDVKLSARCVLRGNVVWSDGSPVRSGRVVVQFNMRERRICQISNGEFSAEDVRREPMFISAVPSGGSEGVAYVAADGESSSDLSVRVVVGNSVQTVRGRVIDGQRRALEGVAVSAAYVMGGRVFPGQLGIRTSGDGEFLLEGVPSSCGDLLLRFQGKSAHQAIRGDGVYVWTVD